MVIAAAGRLYLDGKIRRLLVVCPASVLPVWEMEFGLHAAYPHSVLLLEGPVPKRIRALESFEGPGLLVAVTNYEGLWRMEDAVTKWQPDMVIADESQRIKTPSARQSKAMHRLSRVKYRMILTGTPVTQSPLDVFSQYKFLEPSIFGPSYYAFRNRYAVMGGYGNHQVVSYKHLDDLTKRVHSVAYRVTKDECLDLPPTVDQRLYCELEPEAKKVYRAVARQSVVELEEGRVTAVNVLAKLLRLSQITGGFVGDESGEVREVSRAKLGLLGETLDDLLGADKKVVVFARFLAEISAIRGLLEDKEVRYAYIAGEVPMEHRGEEVRKFQEDPECRVFVAQIQTAGLGITLTAADTMVFYSLSYSYADYDQCRARIHRPGQEAKCTYVHLLARDTVDEKVLRVLARKGDMAREITDSWRDYFREV